MSLQTEAKTITETKLKRPPEFRVIYLNDDVTTVDFVVASLGEVFGYDEDVANHIASDVHNQGSAIVAVLPFELAEQKGSEVIVMARMEGYPLQVRVEPESD